MYNYVHITWVNTAHHNEILPLLGDMTKMFLPHQQITCTLFAKHKDNNILKTQITETITLKANSNLQRSKVFLSKVDIWCLCYICYQWGCD